MLTVYYIDWSIKYNLTANFCSSAGVPCVTIPEGSYSNTFISEYFEFLNPSERALRLIQIKPNLKV